MRSRGTTNKKKQNKQKTVDLVKRIVPRGVSFLAEGGPPAAENTSVFWININLNYYFDYYLLNIIIEHYLVIELWLRKRKKGVEKNRKEKKKKLYLMLKYC